MQDVRDVRDSSSWSLRPHKEEILPLSVRSFLKYIWPERMPMHPNECRFAAKILKICVHARASVSDGTVRGRDYVSQVNSVSESLEINLKSLVFFSANKNYIVNSCDKSCRYRKIYYISENS